jgi:hypothetical protein
MPKTPKTFRLENEVIKKIERLAAFFTEHSPTGSMPGQTQKVTNTDVIEFAIKKYYEDLHKEGYEI